MRKMYLFQSSFLLFIIFILFTILVSKNYLTSFDFDVTINVQSLFSRKWDDLFSYFSVIGSFEIMFLLLFILLVLRRKISGLLYFFYFGIFLLFELLGKMFINQVGPPSFLGRYKTIVHFPTDYVPHPVFAYPSGHSGRTMFLSTILLFIIFNNKNMSIFLKLFLALIIIFFDIIMLVSRVYLGEHWTSDVIGGSLLGAAIGLISVGLLEEKRKIKLGI